MENNVKMVPAQCSQCGGVVEVNKDEEKAVCPYCGTTFMIEKGVSDYNVNFDVNGAVKDVLGFVGEQMKESRNERRKQREDFAKNEKSFFKMFAIMFAAMMVFGLIAFVVMQFSPETSVQTAEPPYFTKGVYLNTEEDQTESDRKYYYVFNNETEGHTDGGISGLPFVCEQRDDGVWFSFGGMDPESEDFLTIESVENGIVKGHFKDGKDQEFSPVSDVDPETFDAAYY